MGLIGEEQCSVLSGKGHGDQFTEGKRKSVYWRSGELMVRDVIYGTWRSVFCQRSDACERVNSRESKSV